MSLHGVPKPVWRAFQLLNTHAGSHTVNTTAVTTGGGGGGIQNGGSTGMLDLPSLISAATTVNISGSGGVVASSGRVFLSHWDATGAAENHTSVAVTLTVHCVAGTCPSGSTEAWMIDGNTAANALWQTMGSPAVPSAAQIEALKAHSEIKSTPISWKKKAMAMTAELVMEPNSACVVGL